MKKTIYRDADGHTYWKEEGWWVGAPTNVDGSVDAEEATHIVDFYLEPEEIAALAAELEAQW